MKQIILKIKDNSKLSFLMQLIEQFDFVEIEKINRKRIANKHDFFKSAGMWVDREINAKEIRRKAWDRVK